MKQTIALALLALAACTTEQNPPAQEAAQVSTTVVAPIGETETCTVVKITDGDTFKCVTGVDTLRVRPLAIDAPERGQGEFGDSATAAMTRELPLGSTVTLEYDVQRNDRYNRVLAWVYNADGEMVNERLARQGWVLVLSYAPNIRHIDRIRDAVAQAQADSVGLWAVNGFKCTPKDYRAKRC